MDAWLQVHDIKLKIRLGGLERNYMPKIIARANVAYPDELLSILENYDRKPFGELKFTIDIDENIHNHVYIIFDWTSLPVSREFWTSEIGKLHIDSWCSVSKPELIYLRNLHSDVAI